MLRRNAFVAKIAVDLVYAVESSDSQPFQVKLRRNPQIEINVQRVVVGDKRPRGRASGDGMHHWCFDFYVTTSVEKPAHFLNDARARHKHLTRFFIGDQVQIPLAVPQLDVRQTVPFLR